MRAVRVFVAKVQALFWQRKANREFDDELQEHLRLLTERFVSQGMSPENATAAARRQFGNTALLQQRQREARTFLSLSTLWRDIRFGVRMLRKNPGSTVTVIVALALGIGMNTAVFSFVNTLLLRPPTWVVEPGRLRELWLHHRGSSGIESYLPLTYPDYTYYRDHNRSFEGMLAFDGDPESVIWNRSGQGQVLQGQLVSGNFFSLLGINAALGRTFSAEDDRVDNPHPVVVLGHAFWQQHLGSDPNIVGKSVILNGTNFSVIGVAPAGFSGLLVAIEPDFWAPLTMVERIIHDTGRLTNRQSNWLIVAGRLAPGASSNVAKAEMDVLAHQVEQAHPDTNKNLDAIVVPATLVPWPYRGYVSAFTGLLMAVFVLVLLIACVNAASLLLVRATVRAREMAIRSALGAGRGQLIRQMMVESILLSSIGGCVGVALASWVTRLLLTLKPADLPITLRIPLDWRVLMFTVVVSLITGAVFGIVPALRSARVDTVPVLKEETQSASYRKSRLRNFLMIGEIATCVVLLIGATLCIRSLLNANSIDPGFDTQHVAVATLDPGSLGYSQAKVDAFYQQLLVHIRALPGIVSASYVDHLPLGAARDSIFVVEGNHDDTEQNRLLVDAFRVAPDYFESLGVPLLRGRDFTRHESEESAHVAIVNQTAARRLWPGQDALGQHITLGSEKTSSEVIGVVKTGKYRTLGEEPIPVIYQMQLPPRRVLVVRSSSDAKPLLDVIRREIQVVDPNMAATDLQTIGEYMSLPLFPARTMGLLLGGSGIFALILTAIGLFGVISYVVSQRTHEIGVRMAMGARRGDVLRLVVRQGLLITIIGLAIGLGGAFAATQLLSSLLYGIRPNDPATLVGVSLGLTGVALLACYIPARRAMRIDPAEALRYE
ncbi:ABC transporter permease [Alloacidobacterium sp.]|uniref:ABC transporter permease n=1 Tax=Alloacidobacterium sp. TaxID=2951999 RepID=UPI002D26377B|nr:ABC transporter permease [Alloacidobacterium sp.]HYK35051.1 ABC transporter permease [Alloacidobacterium sp.]